MTSFEGENMQSQYSILGYKIDLNPKLAVEIYENNHDDRNIEYEKKTKSCRRKTWLQVY